MAAENEAIQALGQEIFRLMETGPPAVFDRKRWNGMLMELAMSDPDLKLRLFRFVDVLPALNDSSMLVSHIREYFLEGDSPIPPLLKRLLAGMDTVATRGAAAALVRHNIVAFSHVFIAGETPAAALPVLAKRWQEGNAVTVDILGEAALSEAEALAYLAQYQALLDTLAQQMAGWHSHDTRHEQRFPRLNVSVKVSSLFSRIGPMNHDESLDVLKERLRLLFRSARAARGCINLDMETRDLKDLTLDVYRELLEEEEFQGWGGAGIALQAYLKETWDDLHRLIAWAREGGRRIMVRLVKGAYWEYETITARQRNWLSPVYTEKTHTDWNYERCAELLLENADVVAPALATHNVRTLAAVMQAAKKHGVSVQEFEFQMLFGMAEPVKRAVVGMGYAVREYTPVGAIIPGMAYLVRRLLENSSDEGFLRKTYVDQLERDALLAPPAPWPGESQPPEHGGEKPFQNEPLLDFSCGSVRTDCAQAIASVRGQLGRQYAGMVGGREVKGEERIRSVSPAQPWLLVGEVVAVSRADVATALAQARAAQPAWEEQGAQARAAILFRAAQLARDRRYELMAWQVQETGKNRAEADADVAEAIDHLEYYGREMLRLAPPARMGEVSGEDNRYFYQARGVALVIAPWNFPFAISAGMVGAALVAGNAVLYKPSSQSPVIGALLYGLLREAGVPNDVLHYLPGHGETVGGWLAEHPDVDLIAFTGSREVGLSLLERAAKPSANTRTVKRVIAEMGGKNAVIVDEDADLDLAVSGVLHSAFGFQGQKCSACSRAIVLAGCYERFLERLVEAVRGIPVGSPENPANVMGPLIDATARSRLARYAEIARGEGCIAVEGQAPEGECYFPPMVVTDLPPDSAVLRDELFGPLLAVVKARNLDEAIAMANDSDYALTGGLYSRSPANIQRVARAFAVGNLYINRPITGAMVGRQSFGGFKMSGVGSKAGGPDYLLQFLEPRVVTENTMRRGFSPEVLS